MVKHFSIEKVFYEKLCYCNKSENAMCYLTMDTVNYRISFVVKKGDGGGGGKIGHISVLINLNWSKVFFS